MSYAKDSRNLQDLCDDLRFLYIKNLRTQAQIILPKVVQLRAHGNSAHKDVALEPRQHPGQLVGMGASRHPKNVFELLKGSLLGLRQEEKSYI